MTQLNQKMAELLDDISNAMTEKLMAIVGQMTPADKTKLEKLLIAYETDCSTFRELLIEDIITTDLAELTAAEAFLPRIAAASSTEIVPVVTEVVNYIKDQIEGHDLAAGLREDQELASGGSRTLAFDDEFDPMEDTLDSDLDFFDPELFGDDSNDA